MSQSDAEMHNLRAAHDKHGLLTKKEVFKWKISANHVQRGNARSDIFTFGPAKNTRFCLMLTIDPEKSDYLQNQFGVCLCKVSTSDTDVSIKVSLGLLDTKDRLHYNCEKVLKDTDKVYATFDYNVFEKHQMIFLQKGVLTFQCSLDVEEAIFEEELSNCLVSNIPESDESQDLVNDMLTLLDSEKFSDFSLSTKEREFQVHRSILAARSPVFAAMIEHDTLEKTQNRVIIEDVDSCVIYQLLRYLYTGNTDQLTPGVALSLFAAADKYSLPKLKKKCSNYLCSNLTIEMVLEVITMANLHQDDSLKEASVNLILRNVTTVMKNEQWLKFLRDYPELANFIILRLAERR